MPLTEDILGTNADGTKNEEYCIYCYKDGAFTGDFTMEEMAELSTNSTRTQGRASAVKNTRKRYSSSIPL